MSCRKGYPIRVVRGKFEVNHGLIGRFSEDRWFSTSLLTGDIFPPKVGFFLSFFGLYCKLPTRDVLRRHGIDVPAGCVFCNEAESISHLFIALYLLAWHFQDNGMCLLPF